MTSAIRIEAYMRGRGWEGDLAEMRRNRHADWTDRD